VVGELITAVVDTMEPDCLDVVPVGWLSSVSEKRLSGWWLDALRVGRFLAGVLASVSRKVFSDEEANCRRLARELNGSLSEARQWMMRPVERISFGEANRA
jgi:hypothetical protein